MCSQGKYFETHNDIEYYKRHMQECKVGLGGIRKIKTVRYCFKITQYN